jgi:hypothetical protein
MYDSILYRLYNKGARFVSSIKMRNLSPLNEHEKQKLVELLASDYYIILTGNKYTLSGNIVKFLSLLLNGKWPKYTHVLMNCDFMSNSSDKDKFKFMEATSSGVHYSTFDQVFDCTNVCILSPRNIRTEDFTEIIDELIKQDGKPYDDLFQLSDESRLSCVELVRIALKANDSYYENFSDLERMISSEKNLTPQMFRDCEDFLAILETD